MTRRAVTLLLLGLLACVNAQPACRVYKTFNTAVSNSGTLMDTIVVGDAFPVGSLKVTNLVLGHPAPSTLELSLVHKPTTPEAAATNTLVLKAGPDGTYAPQEPVTNGADAAGQWVLKVADTQPGAETRLISLTSWALLLCPSTAPVTAADGPKMPNVDVSVSRSGVSVDVTKSATAKDDSKTNSNNDDDSKNATLRVSVMGDHADNLLHLLWPGSAAAKTDGNTAVGLITAVKAAGRKAADTQITDAFAFAAKQSELYKDFANKKLSDLINGVNGGAALATGVITNKSGLFKPHGASLLGFISNLKGMLAADAQGKIESLINLAAQLGGLTSSVGSDLKSTTGLLHQLVTAKLGGLFKVYVAVEGIAKTHMDNALAAKVAVLDAMLDKIIAGLSVAQGSKLTGPVVDFKLQMDAAKLKTLSRALDALAAAAKAIPTPSQVVVSKVAAFGDVFKQTRVAELMSTLSDGSDTSSSGWAPRNALVAPLMGKVEKAQSLLSQATKDSANNKDAGGNKDNKDAGNKDNTNN